MYERGGDRQAITPSPVDPDAIFAFISTFLNVTVIIMHVRGHTHI
jgi:hypothetical protein